jgi:hypothetical protein
VAGNTIQLTEKQFSPLDRGGMIATFQTFIPQNGWRIRQHFSHEASTNQDDHDSNNESLSLG